MLRERKEEERKGEGGREGRGDKGGSKRGRRDINVRDT